MSECSLSGRGQGHVSNFYIVDLENFTTASRRYTGDIHNSTVVVVAKRHAGTTAKLMAEVLVVGFSRFLAWLIFSTCSVNCLLRIPLHLVHVATLPCEVLGSIYYHVQ